MIPAANNPNVPPPPGEYKPGEPLIYTQVWSGGRREDDAEFLQLARMRDGFAVVLVGDGRVRSVVPLQDLRRKPAKEPGR